MQCPSDEKQHDDHHRQRWPGDGEKLLGRNTTDVANDLADEDRDHRIHGRNRQPGNEEAKEAPLHLLQKEPIEAEHALRRFAGRVARRRIDNFLESRKHQTTG